MKRDQGFDLRFQIQQEQNTVSKKENNVNVDTCLNHVLRRS